MTSSRGSGLPELLAEIAEVAGLPAALAIADTRGGTKVHFPASVADDHWLVATVGREAADRLCDHFRVNHKGGVTVVVPRGPARFYAVARCRALAMRAEGASIALTARTIGVTSRTVEVWTAAARASPARKPSRKPDTKPRKA